MLAEAGDRSVEEAIHGYLASRTEVVGRLSRFIRAFAAEEVTDIAALTVAVRQLRAVVG